MVLEAQENKKLVNFFDETMDFLKANHKMINKAGVYILNAYGYITRAEFDMTAKEINYDPHSGHITIDPTLKIVGHFWWIERRFTGEREGWYLCKLPFKPQTPSVYTSLLYTADMIYQPPEESIGNAE